MERCSRGVKWVPDSLNTNDILSLDVLQKSYKRV